MSESFDIKSIGRIIAATRSDAEFAKAVDSGSSVIFDLDFDLIGASSKIKKARESGKKLFVHIDLAKGIGKDESAIEFLKKIGIDGIISTKVHIIKHAREKGMFTVQRFFIVDSQSVKTTVEATRLSRPDMIEIMPGLVCKAISKFVGMLDIPIIAGGLINSEEEAELAFRAGASAVSTGCSEIWK